VQRDEGAVVAFQGVERLLGGVEGVGGAALALHRGPPARATAAP